MVWLIGIVTDSYNLSLSGLISNNSSNSMAQDYYVTNIMSRTIEKENSL